MTVLSIRIVAAADQSDLATLLQGFRDHLLAKRPTDFDLDQYLPMAILDPNTEFACAWLHGKAVGFTQMRFVTSIWVSGVEAHLEDMFVIQSARGQKVGRSLLHHAVARAEARTAVRIILKTNEKNHAAQDLYTSSGFKPTSHLLYPGGREIFLTKDLSPRVENDLQV